jgi:serine/threonine-protein kinase
MLIQLNRLYPAIRILLLASLAFFLATGCVKTSIISPSSTAPVISAISVQSGPYGSLVTISGMAFSPDTSKESVRFNGTIAAIQSATDTNLVVKVPQGAGTGPITVIANGDTTTGPIFTYQLTVTVSTLAGNPATQGFADGTGSTATFIEPEGVAVDTLGNVYVADFIANVIRKITPAGVVTTLAGNPNAKGTTNGTGSAADFNNPESIALDAQENIYIGEGLDIRKITPAGAVTTLAGNGNYGYVDGPGSTAEFSNPDALALDASGNVYAADFGNAVIRKITPAGVTSTLAGNGTSGYVDGAGSEAEFMAPTGMGIDGTGNLYTADFNDTHIRKITPSGTVSTFAGNGQPGFVNGPAASAEFNTPFGIVLDGKGNIYISDQGNQCIRMITPSGTVSTLAGNGTAGYQDGPGASAEFNSPYGIAVDAQGNVYVADGNNSCIRKITVQ